MEDIGKGTIVPCPLQDENISEVWITADDQIIASLSTESQSSIKFDPLTDADHGRSYSCQGNSSGGIQYYNFTMVALGEIVIAYNRHN